jgi:NADPH2 dehydrogenase
MSTNVYSKAKLFTPIQVGNVQLRHRVVQAPMTRLRVDPSTNVIFPIVKEFYGQRANTPGTLVISEGTDSCSHKFDHLKSSPGQAQ